MTVTSDKKYLNFSHIKNTSTDGDKRRPLVSVLTIQLVWPSSMQNDVAGILLDVWKQLEFQGPSTLCFICPLGNSSLRTGFVVNRVCSRVRPMTMPRHNQSIGN